MQGTPIRVDSKGLSGPLSIMHTHPTVAEAIWKQLGFAPTHDQLPIVHSYARKKLVCGGVRSGKSYTSAMDAIPKIVVADTQAYLKQKEAGLYWLVGQDYESCRAEWNYLVENLGKLGLLVKGGGTVIDPGEMVLAGGTRIVTKSGRYPEKIATEACDGILVCEAAQISFEIFLRLSERLSERRGWLNMAGTIEAPFSWYIDLFNRWRGKNDEDAAAFSLPSWSNSYVYPGGWDDPEIDALRNAPGMTGERFMERFGGVPQKPKGLVVYNFNNELHVRLIPDPESSNPVVQRGFDTKPVYLAIDPGYAGAYAVLAIQEWGDQVCVFDEIYVQHRTIEEVISICQQKPWWGLVEGGAIDIAAKQHQADRSQFEVWRDKARVHLQMGRVHWDRGGAEDGVNLLNSYFMPNPITGLPKLIVSHRCQGLIAECGGGVSPIENGGAWVRNESGKIVDKFDHSAKALTYWLMQRYGFTERRLALPKIRVKR